MLKSILQGSSNVDQRFRLSQSIPVSSLDVKVEGFGGPWTERIFFGMTLTLVGPYKRDISIGTNVYAITN
jgi:hypothetical protein